MKKLPMVKTEAAERKYWADHDSTEHIDWDRGARVVLPNLKPSQTTISLRLPGMMLAELKRLANKRDVPYQSLLKMFLAERIDEEVRGSRAGNSAMQGAPAASRRGATKPPGRSTTES